MTPPDHDKPGALARDLMRRATIAQLSDDATELAALVAGLQRPLPVMPFDPVQREAVLLIQLLRERDRSRRILDLLLAGHEV